MKFFLTVYILHGNAEERSNFEKIIKQNQEYLPLQQSNLYWEIFFILLYIWLTITLPFKSKNSLNKSRTQLIIDTIHSSGWNYML
jgi:hypothetical protein